MNPDADVTYQSYKFLFSSHKCFIYFISDVSHYIRTNQHSNICAILVKVDVLDTCGAMICLYFGTVFLLFLMKIKKCCVHIFPWFLTSWTFRITSLLNWNEYQCYHYLDLSMIEGFHGFVMFSFSLSYAKETLQKMLARKCSYHGRIGNKC